MAKAYLRLLVDARSLRELSTLHAIVKVGTYFIVGLLLAALWANKAHAQTATPYPADYYRGSYGSVFSPGGYDEDAFWVCQAHGEGLTATIAADVILGDSCYAVEWEYIEGFGARSISFGISGLAEDDTSVEASLSYLALIAPKDIMTYTMSCDFTAVRYFHSGGGITYSANSSLTVNEGANVAELGNPFPNFLSGETTVLVSWQDDIERTVVPSISNGWWQSVPNFSTWLEDPGSSDGPVQFNMSGTALGQNNGISQQLICTVSNLRVASGGEWEGYPEEIYPTPTPGAYPTLVGSDPWPTPVAWVPGNPALIMTGTLGITPIGTTCYTVLPNVEATGGTVFGFLIPDYSSPEFEVCLEEHSLGLNFMGWDFGLLVVAVAALGMGGAFYGLMRMG